MNKLDLIATYRLVVAASGLSGQAVIRAKFRGGKDAEVDLDFNRRTCIVRVRGFDFDSEVVSLLETTPPLVNGGDYPVALGALVEDLRATAESVLHVWKYIIARDEAIHEGALATESLMWREADAETWRRIPGAIRGAAAIGQIPSLVGVTAQHLQEAVDDGIEPLVGMAYLHRAKSEPDPRYRWVDATVAAELCIKEVLIAARSEAEVLLNNLPSPPLSKLYGEVLEAYLGEKSPYLNAIARGVEKRNKLVHRPQTVVVTARDAQDYVIAVEAAIFHAWELLHRGKAYLAPSDFRRPVVVDL